jgi:hypothetical protein
MFVLKLLPIEGVFLPPKPLYLFVEVLLCILYQIIKVVLCFIAMCRLVCLCSLMRLVGDFLRIIVLQNPKSIHETVVKIFIESPWEV